MREILNLIERPIVVFSNGVNPLDPKPREGYHQRIAAVDAYLGDHNRVYVKTNPSFTSEEQLHHLGPGCMEIEIGEQYSSQIADLIRRAAGLYSHSIYPLLHPTVRRLVSERNGPLIVDMHGVVPEEIDFIERSPQTQLYERLESWATLEADALIHVTAHMLEHFRQKYPWTSAQHIICPIFVERGSPGLPRAERGNTIIYAGGAQPWQQVDRIVDAVSAGLPRYRSKILTHQPDIFIEKFRAKGINPDGEKLSIRSARPNEVRAAYDESQFGILCRENHVINRVACPTKLVEYLYHGVVPVMGTPAVGDFVDLGMQFVPIEDIVAHALPTPAECEKMAAQNLKVLDRLAEMAHAGRAAILTLLKDRLQEQPTACI